MTAFERGDKSTLVREAKDCTSKTASFPHEIKGITEIEVSRNYKRDS